jgi:hypothetical protein
MWEGWSGYSTSGWEVWGRRPACATVLHRQLDDIDLHVEKISAKVFLSASQNILKL